jgi:antitoxin component of RelBE/YafQ-DinJ toxin-antitoxin module
MTVIFRSRVDPQKLKKAEKIASDLGTSVPELFRIFITEVARTGSVPLSLAVGQKEEPLFSKERRNKIWRELDDSEGW